MFKQKTKLLAVATTTTLLLASAYSNAFTITKTRLFLDPQNKTTSMSVLNSESRPLNCRVSVRNLDVENGSLVIKPEEESRNPSPEKLIKLAPRRFKLGVRSSQEFKVIYRRRPNIEEGEYIGAVAIRCSSPTERSDKVVSIEPSLVHNVPLIVRTGKLSTSVSLTDAVKTSDAVTVNVAVDGDRSVSGNIRLSNAQSGSVISEVLKWSHYPEQPAKKVTFELPADARNEPLKVTFSEMDVSGKVKAEAFVK